MELKNGGVIAVPTDTVYGLCCLSSSDEAIQKIYEIKNRPFNKPLPVCMGCVDDIYRFTDTSITKDRLSNLLPGAVTLVLKRGKNINPNFNPGQEKLAVRVTPCSLLQNIIVRCGEPVALTSANISDGKESRCVDDFSSLHRMINYIVDIGPVAQDHVDPCPSTIIDLSVSGYYKILRSGVHTSNYIRILESWQYKKQ